MTASPAAAAVTPRMRGCLAQTPQGLSSTHIGAELRLSPYTVDDHLIEVRRRLARTRVQAVVKALALSLIPQPAGLRVSRPRRNPRTRTEEDDLMPDFLRPAAVALLVLAAIPTLARAAEPRTAEAVKAVDDAWSTAEIRGDTGFLEAMLAPEYRSVGSNGKITLKAAIVEHARRNQDPAMSATTMAQVETWRAAHPHRTDTTLVGDMAILTFISTTPGAQEPVASCDVFVYRGGRWHAIYSQHTSAGT